MSGVIFVIILVTLAALFSNFFGFVERPRWLETLRDAKLHGGKLRKVDLNTGWSSTKENGVNNCICVSTFRSGN